MIVIPVLFVLWSSITYLPHGLLQWSAGLACFMLGWWGMDYTIYRLEKRRKTIDRS